MLRHHRRIKYRLIDLIKCLLEFTNHLSLHAR